MARAFRALELLLAALLLAMVVMVFGNVVLRYAFNSGITVSEELSRFCFVWLTFVGAVVAMRDGAHLGMTNVVDRLPRTGKIACAAINQVLIIACCALMLWGTIRQHEINATAYAPGTDMSMIWIFGMGYVAGGGIALLALHKLWRILTGSITDAERIGVVEDVDLPQPHGRRGAR
jgi:TRAP-type C4-dicarboxylate transport system permease small subunit